MNQPPVNNNGEALFSWARRSIGFPLIVAFVLVAMLPVSIAVASSLAQWDRQAHQQIIAQLNSVSDLKAAQIHEWLAEKQSRLGLLLANSKANADAVDSLGPAGDHQALAVEALTQFLTEQVAATDAFDEFFLYDAQGKIWVSTAARQVGKNVVAEPYYKASLTAKSVQSPFYEVSSADLNMIVSQPVVDARGQTLGVLAGRANLAELSNTMTQRSGLGSSGETYLVSLENNYLVTASRFEGYPLTQAYHSQGIDRVLSGQSGSGVYVNYRGVQAIGVYEWLPEIHAGLVAEIDEVEALSPINASRTFSIIVATIAGILGVALGLGVTFWLTRPLRDLTRTAAAITTGDYTQRAAVTRQNEIGQLAAAFNKMTANLVQTIDELNQRIEEIRQAKEAARAKEVFLATMSHELRTPLNAMIGFLGIMGMSGKLDARNTHMVQRTRANAERLLALINDILEISRLEAGRQQLVSEPIHIRDLVEKLQSQMDVLAETKGLKFAVEVGEEVPDTIYTDQDALTKMITNLLGNAFKFTDQGSVTLKVSSAADTFKIAVSDTGVGIPVHLHQVIFESFRQVDGSSTRAHGGSGLGLSIVHQLCKAMNGAVTLTSQPGQGSTFTVSLPLVTAQAVEPQLEQVV